MYRPLPIPSRIVKSTTRLFASCLMTLTMLACIDGSDRQTLAELRDREPDLSEATIDKGVDQAMAGYRKFLEEAPKSSLTPEAMRRLADLKLEKEYGFLDEPSDSESPAAALPAPEKVDRRTQSGDPSATHTASKEPKASGESDRAFEQRAAGIGVGDYRSEPEQLALPGQGVDPSAGPLEAIALYDQILKAYPNYAHNDQVLYQKARAYDELGRVDEAIAVAALLAERYPNSRHLDEIQFRRAEYFFTRKKLVDAEEAYTAIVNIGPSSDYYELALYKMGWTFYKQMLLDEAVETYVTLLDHKVSTGYDFDQTENEGDAQRISDTYRVISLCFSDLGGAEAIRAFFTANGQRNYENRVYQHLGEFGI